MAPTTKKRERKTAPTETASSGSTAPLHDLIAQANRFIEGAAIIRAVRAEVVQKFHSDTNRLPPLLLQRRGSGPRPAMTEAIVDAEVALDQLARQLDERARALLVLPVALGENEAPAPADIQLVDEVVSTSDLEFEVAMTQQELKKKAADERIIAEKLRTEISDVQQRPFE